MAINGAALKAIREAQGWNITRLATQSQLSHSYIRDLEQGRRKGRNPGVAKALAEALNVPTAAITVVQAECTGVPA